MPLLTLIAVVRETEILGVALILGLEKLGGATWAQNQRATGLSVLGVRPARVHGESRRDQDVTAAGSNLATVRTAQRNPGVVSRQKDFAWCAEQLHYPTATFAAFKLPLVGECGIKDGHEPRAYVGRCETRKHDEVLSKRQ